MTGRAIQAGAVLAGLLAVASGARAAEILNTGSYWRYRIVWETEETRLASGQVGHYRFRRESRKPPKWVPEKVEARRLPADTPPDWMKPGFDGGSWGRMRGPILGLRRRGIHGTYKASCKSLYARAAFEITNPCDLTLSMTFKGGVVVYLNGQEVARAFMPKGKAGLYTLAKDYPKEAYTDPEGFLLVGTGRDKQKH